MTRSFFPEAYQVPCAKVFTMRKLLAVGASILAVGGGTTALCLASSLAIAQDKPDVAKFSLLPNPAFLTCLSKSAEAPSASVVVKRGDPDDTAIIRVKGLKPYLNFTLFTVQRSSLDSSGAPVSGFKGFGLSSFQSELHSDGNGDAKVVIKTILLDQIFAFDADAVPPPPNTVLKPTNTFEMGLWFDNPEDAQPCGFDVTKPTPFNGAHRAGPLAMISVPVPPANLGPLCTSPTGAKGPDDSGADPNNSTVLACNP
jgi:hypothetical protein